MTGALVAAGTGHEGCAGRVPGPYGGVEEIMSDGLRLDTTIETLGPPTLDSPLTGRRFISEEHVATITLSPEDLDDVVEETEVEFELAGPRKRLWFDPAEVRAAVVTCGGLCPGLNDVIHAIVLEALNAYHVASVVGIRFGLQGFIPRFGHQPMELTPQSVAGIHQQGGTILGTSRGPQPIDEVVDFLERSGIDQLFIIGGDGTMKAAMRITAEIRRRNAKIAVIGVPKTIDNDINLVTSSFGFDTAVECAAEAIRCVHTEAVSVPNGIGLVKLMGRESGFIAAQAALVAKDADYVLVPEAPFALYGEGGLLPSLAEHLRAHGNAVIVVAEGAGQHLIATESVARQTDLSGNLRLGDIASLLIREIDAYLTAQTMPHAFKYIDPSYLIRSVPANANDRIYCGFLGQYAVHAAMAGKTGMVVSKLYGRYVHLPFALVTRRRRTLNLTSSCWQSILETTDHYRLTCATQ